MYKVKTCLLKLVVHQAKERLVLADAGKLLNIEGIRVASWQKNTEVDLNLIGVITFTIALLKRVSIRHELLPVRTFF